MMCDKELLVEYLYGEIDDASRQALERHLAACAACREEVAGLRSTRRHLQAWAPPEPRLGFQIVSGAPAPLRRRFSFAPAWGLAAAAVLVLAAAAAIANVEVRYGGDGLVVRTGWGPGATPQVAARQVATQPAAAPAGVVPAQWEATIKAFDERLREIERQPRQPSLVTQASGPRLSDAEVRRVVSALLVESEARQNRQLAMRIRQLALEIDAQRRMDLATIQQGIQGATGAEAATHQQLVNYVQGLYRVSQQVK